MHDQSFCNFPYPNFNRTSALKSLQFLNATFFVRSQDHCGLSCGEWRIRTPVPLTRPPVFPATPCCHGQTNHLDENVKMPPYSSTKIHLLFVCCGLDCITISESLQESYPRICILFHPFGTASPDNA